jgi:3-keto-disaccharide hydrolase
MKAFVAILVAASLTGQAKDNTPPEGFTALFNGKDLSGWQGLVEYPKRDKDPEKYAAQVKAANEKYLPHWTVKDGVIHYDGKGQSLQTVKDYGDFELLCDWKIEPKGDSGLYLRGTPQVQIWDPAKNGGVGSGGLYNNQDPKNPSKPLKLADKPVGEWNHFRIVMKGDKVSVWLNNELVVDNTVLEGYWGRKKGEPSPPVPEKGPIELQHHGDHLEFKNIYIKELN